MTTGFTVAVYVLAGLVLAGAIALALTVATDPTPVLKSQWEAGR